MGIKVGGPKVTFPDVIPVDFKAKYSDKRYSRETLLYLGTT